MSCQDTERLLELRAAELLSAEEETALDQHLAACADCSGAADGLQALLMDSRLPPFTEAEEQRLQELRRVRPLPREGHPWLRWGATAAAIAASALVGLQLGGPRAGTQRSGAQQRASVPAQQVAAAPVIAVSPEGDLIDDGAFVSASADTDSTLYDAVLFQGGVMPFDLDNG
jgi:hypothetical protein